MRLRFGFAMGGSHVRPPPLKDRAKRAVSGTDTVASTPSQTIDPTAPPPSADNSGVPKIAGSEAGFIGLMVGFGVLIFLCCVAVYYLLHTRKHGGRHNNKNYPASAPTGTTRGLFSNLHGRRKQDAGWVQQGDEFDYDSDDDDLMMRKDPALHTPMGLGYGVGAGYGEGGTGYAGKSHPMQHSQGVKSLATTATGDAYTDPFDPEHLPERVRRQQAPLPASTSIDPPLYNSIESDSALKQSPTTSTFEGGTKFREQF